MDALANFVVVVHLSYFVFVGDGCLGDGTWRRFIGPVVPRAAAL
jgi:hypothetical protein